MKTILLTLLAATIALAAASAGGARRGDTDPCPQPGATQVKMKASDGASVYGVEFGSGTTGVVLGHQVFSNHCEFVAFAQELAKHGFRAIAIDFRGYGLSRGGAPGRLDRDLAAAVARLRADGATKVDLVGASMGGTAALVAASWIAPAVNGVVSLSGPARYQGLDALRAVRRLRVPVRFVVSRADRPFSTDAVTLMKAAAARDKAIYRVAGARHGSLILDVPAAERFVLGFLGR